MEKALQIIEEMTRLGIIKSYAIGGGIAATYYIEPALTYDLDIFFIPVKEGLDELAPIYKFARGTDMALRPRPSSSRASPSSSSQPTTTSSAKPCYMPQP